MSSGFLLPAAGYNDEVDRSGNPPHLLVDQSGYGTGMIPAGLYHEEVEVAVRPCGTPGHRAKEEDLFRLCNLNDPADDLIELSIADQGNLFHDDPRPGDDSLYLRDDIIAFS